MRGIPEGWTRSGIQELFEFKYGKGLPREKRSDQGFINVYGSNGIVGLHDAAITKGPTIIIGRKGSVGEIHLSKHSCWPIDTTYYIDRFPADLPPQYWVRYLKALGLGEQEKSSAIPGISRDDIHKIEVLLPPLLEQHRIVAKLEKLLHKVDVCQARLEKIPTILKRFRQSILAAACSGRLTAGWRVQQNALVCPVASNRQGVAVPPLHEGEGRGEGEDLPSGWVWKTLADVCEAVVDCPHSTPKWTSTGFLCVRTTNFKPGFLDLSEMRFVSEETFNERIERLRPMPGDILYSREGGILGIACMIPPDIELCLGQRMMLFRVKENYKASLLMSILSHYLTTTAMSS